MKRIIPIAASVILFAAICFGFYITRDINVYGHAFSADRGAVAFNGDEIDDVDGLIGNLKKFPALRRADLGTYEISVEESKKLQSEFPNAEFTAHTYVEFCGKRILTDSKDVDLSDLEIEKPDEIMSLLPYLTDLEQIDFGKNVIPHELKESIQTDSPDVEINAVCTYEVNGKTVREDTQTLDLSGYKNCEELPELLRLFPDAKTVDLTGANIPAEIQYELVEERPETSFKWAVDFGGTQFDADCEEVDLSGTEGVSAEDVRKRIPLFNNLKRIDLTGCDATNEEMAKIREDFPDISVVWTLYMGKWSLKTDATAFSVLIYDYKHTRLTSEDIEVLKYTTNLKALDLGHQAITDLSVIGDYLTELRVLILADNAVSNLAPLAKLKHLHYLELFVNWIYDISPLAELDELVDVNISYNYSISNIRPLLEQPMLERLWIESTNVSKEDVKLLEETYPRAKIVREGEGSVDQGWRTHYRYWAMMDMWFNDYISEAFTNYDR